MALIIGPVHITIFKSIKVNKLNGKYFQRYLSSLSLSPFLTLCVCISVYNNVCRIERVTECVYVCMYMKQDTNNDETKNKKKKVI